MANIKNELNNIKSAIYGKDVRSSIHNGIDAINKEVENTTGRQVDLENTFDQLVINAGNSNAEIVDARVKSDGTSYSKLGDRLDAVDSQLAHIESYKNDIGVDLNKFNVIGDGVTDDIVNINKALLFAKDNSINIVSFNDKTYFITDTIEVPDNIILNMNNTKIKYVGTSNNKPAIRLSNNSKIINKCSIEMDDTPGSANKCWILLGDFQTGQGISNVYIDNVELLGGFNNCNGISIAGDTNSVVINRLDCSNTTKPGRVIMAHWGNFNDHYVNGDSYVHVNNYKPTTHPYNIKINEVIFGDLDYEQADAGVVLASACYNFEIGTIKGRSCDIALNIFPGDLGFKYSTYKGEKNFLIKNINVENIKTRHAIRVNGTGLYEDNSDKYSLIATEINVNSNNGQQELITLSGVVNSKISSSKLNGGKEGIRVGLNCDNVVIENCEVLNTKHQGIFVTGSISNKNKNITIKSCVVKSSGLSTTDSKSGSGICLDSCDNVTVKNCFTTNTKYSGVFIGENCINSNIQTNSLIDCGNNIAITSINNNYDSNNRCFNNISNNSLRSGGVFRQNMDRVEIITALSVPTQGAWKKGAIAINPNPDEVNGIGWICTEDGTPGKWQKFGKIGKPDTLRDSDGQLWKLVVSTTGVISSIRVSE